MKTNFFNIIYSNYSNIRFAFKTFFNFLDKKNKIKLYFLQFKIIIANLLEVLSIFSVIPIFFSFADKNLPFINNLAIKYSISDYLNLNNFILISLSLLILSNIFQIYVKVSTSKFGLDITRFIQNKLFNAYLNSNYKFYSSKDESYFLNMIKNEVWRIRSGVFEGVVTLFSHIIFLILITVSLIIYNSKFIMIIFLIIFIFYIIHYILIIKKLESNAVELTKAQKNLIQYINDIFSSIKHIIFEKKNFNKILNKNDNLIKNTNKIFFFNDAVKSTIRKFFEIYIFLTSIILIIYYPSNLELKSLIADYGVFLIALFRVLPVVNNTYNCIYDIFFHLNAVKNVKNDISFVDNLKKTSEINFKINKLELENVNYSVGDKKILSNINLKIKEGDTIAIIGESGSGKTTLVDIISGIINPTSGNIKVNNNTFETDKYTYYEQLTYCPQKNVIINDTLENNISWQIDGNNIDQSKIYDAIKKSEISDRLNEFIGNDSIKVGKEGINLSGGENQRIGIARLFYRNKNINILDESFSNIDEQKSIKIFNQIILEKKRNITILITHNLNLLKFVDKIIILSRGKLIKETNFEDFQKNFKDYIKKND